MQKPTKRDFRNTVIILLLALMCFIYAIFAEISKAALTEDQKARNNNENYVSVEFNHAPLEDLLFFVAEMTGQAFVLTAKDVTLSWVQKDIYKNDLVHEFMRVVVSSGLTILKSGSGKVIVISDNGELAGNSKSLQKLDGGNKVYLSEINDNTGRYVLFLGIIYKIDDFPFPVIESPLGLMSIVPTDVYLADQRYKSQLVQLEKSDPNDLNNVAGSDDPVN